MCPANRFIVCLMNLWLGLWSLGKAQLLAIDSSSSQHVTLFILYTFRQMQNIVSLGSMTSRSRCVCLGVRIIYVSKYLLHPLPLTIQISLHVAAIRSPRSSRLSWWMELLSFSSFSQQSWSAEEAVPAALRLFVTVLFSGFHMSGGFVLVCLFGRGMSRDEKLWSSRLFTAQSWRLDSSQTPQTGADGYWRGKTRLSTVKDPISISWLSVCQHFFVVSWRCFMENKNSSHRSHSTQWFPNHCCLQ